MEVDLAKHTYFFALPCYDGKLSVETTAGLLDSVSKLSQHNIVTETRMVRSGALIDATRNELVHYFLNNSKADILIFIDSDIAFTWEQMKRLLGYATKYPIVCGSYTCKTEFPEFIVTPSDNKLNEDGLLPIDSIGIGFTAIHRSVFSQLNVSQYLDKKVGSINAFFRMLIEDSKYTGEDIYFFNKCKEAGLQPMLDPFIELGHIGIKNYSTPFKDVLGLIIKE